MTDFCQQLLLWSYILPAGLLALFAINLYILLFFFQRRHRARSAEAAEIRAAGLPPAEALPLVVTQLPIYNEFNVIERCLRATVAMRWGGEHLVQVLDDSTDETSELVDRLAAELNTDDAIDCRVEVVRRSDRIGYKAGALEHAMAEPGAADAEYFCIFDADFVPPADFLERSMVVMLARPRVGIVQARWGHLNRNDSILTRAQALGIDGHFAIEQPARAWNGLFMNFNGTAGLWRRSAIADAGGWEHDTLTEDMDLSYRAQLAGWEPFFLWDLEAPAELPADINAFKSQQFRWAKGSIETAIKLLGRVFRSPDFGLMAKMQAVFHMTHYLVHPIMLWMALMFYPVVTWTGLHDHPLPFGLLVGLILVSTIAPSALYTYAQLRLNPGGGFKRLLSIPVLSLLGIGIAISNTRAVWQAVRGRQSAFVRTPKMGDSATAATAATGAADATAAAATASSGTVVKRTKQYAIRLPGLAFAELAVGVYCWVCLVMFMREQHRFILPFILLYACGFTFVGLLSLAVSFKHWNTHSNDRRNNQKDHDGRAARGWRSVLLAWTGRT